ncbi:MAG: hypothetical protein OXH70_19430 [Acidobacteria bacterium]|nr:hypothetical protein [Acidobacteriota bacterium]
MLRRLLREGSRFPSTVGISMLVAALSAAAGLATAQAPERGARLEGLKRLDLPQGIGRASDVRWLADGEIVLGVIGSGIQAWRLVESGAELRVALEDPAPEVLEIGGRAVVVDGSIHDSLDAATFFAETGCDVEPNEWGNSPLNDAYARADWLSPRRIIDEVVADGAGNVYFFVRYGADRPGPEAAADLDSLPDLGPRAAATDITATLPNTDPACCQWQPKTAHFWQLKTAHLWRDGRGRRRCPE